MSLESREGQFLSCASLSRCRDKHDERESERNVATHYAQKLEPVFIFNFENSILGAT